jgi:hypothetical protein
MGTGVNYTDGPRPHISKRGCLDNLLTGFESYFQACCSSSMLWVIWLWQQFHGTANAPVITGLCNIGLSLQMCRRKLISACMETGVVQAAHMKTTPFLP